MLRANNTVAVVTGASRGVGKGIALALGAAGATVYVTGRTLESREGGLPGSLRETAEEIDARGGRGVAVACDHAKDEDVRALFARVAEEQQALDILVNNAFAIPSGDKLYNTPFWEQPVAYWDTMHQVGLRSHYTASVFAAPLLLASKRGLIANISSFGGVGYQVNVAYGVGKGAVDRLSADMAVDLKPHGVAVVSLYPGVVRTERVLSGELPYPLENSESAELSGRAVVALSQDSARMRHTGKVCVVAELAAEYGFTDVDGSTPRSLRRRKRDKPHTLVREAQELQPRLRDLGRQIERERRVPQELANALAHAGFYRMLVPRSLGGLEVRARVFVEALEALALGDSAVGWTVMTGATTGLLSAYLGEGAALDAFRQPSSTYAGVFAPMGRATPALSPEGVPGFLLNGRWSFASGVENASLRLAGGLVFEAGAKEPRRLPSGDPELRSFFFSASDSEVHDTWETAGLRGTGSHDLSVHDLFVPATDSVCVLSERPRHAGALYAFPLFGLLAMGVSAVGLGIAARAREALLEQAKEARRGRRSLAESELVQVRVAEADADLSAAKAGMVAALERVWTEVEAQGDQRVSLAQRVALRQAATHAARVAARSVDVFYGLGGGRALYTSSPLERCLRDVHTLTQHIMVAEGSWVAPGRFLLDQPLNAAQL